MRVEFNTLTGSRKHEGGVQHTTWIVANGMTKFATFIPESLGSSTRGRISQRSVVARWEGGPSFYIDIIAFYCLLSLEL
jgi:hypothetical protein